jgi:hypothetical protein
MQYSARAAAPYPGCHFDKVIELAPASADHFSVSQPNHSRIRPMGGGKHQTDAHAVACKNTRCGSQNFVQIAIVRVGDPWIFVPVLRGHYNK